LQRFLALRGTKAGLNRCSRQRRLLRGNKHEATNLLNKADRKYRAAILASRENV
jgi:hypothetical protein